MKSLGYLKKHGTTKSIDLTKKNLVPALKRLVKGSLIVYEKDDLVDGVSCAVPVDLFNSSHYYALLIQDSTSNNRNDVWRNPILLTQDFLFNTMDIPDVARSHSLSGVVVKKERLNVHLPSKQMAKDNNILKRTAWDCCILVVPYFILLNSMPFPLSVRVWQFTETDVDTLFMDQALVNEEDDSSGDENQSSSLSSTWVRNMMETAQYHNPPDGSAEDFLVEESVKRGRSLLLSGINVQRRLFLRVSQNVNSPNFSGTKHLWSSPVLIRLDKLRTGANKKGSLSLPKRILDLGDDIDALVSFLSTH